LRFRVWGFVRVWVEGVFFRGAGGGTVVGANLQRGAGIQGYLAHKKLRTPRTLQQDYTWGPMAALGGGAVFHQRGTPVGG